MALLRDYRTTRDLANFIRIKLGRRYIEAENRLSIAEVLAYCGTYGLKDWETEPCYMGVDQGGGHKHLHVLIRKKHPVAAA